MYETGNNPEVLLGFNFIDYMKRHGFIGQLCHENNLPADTIFGQTVPRLKGIKPPIYGILVTVEAAYDECMDWCKQTALISLGKFTTYLKDNHIFGTGKVEAYSAFRDKKR